ncbi:MAG: hydroxymethylbilane synthase, partial [Alphaproteobacteria bacterium]|nr:hydroxymethylbilane synthase [Alphaproteobacteria bacterium]
MTAPVIRIGTRGSKLALTQSGHMRDAIALAAPGAEVVLERVITSGDRIQDRRLTEIGGKALFTKEIEEALLEGRVDCAVHSMKDV